MVFEVGMQIVFNTIINLVTKLGIKLSYKQRQLDFKL